MKKYLTYIMLGLSLTLITDVWATEDLQSKGKQNPKLSGTCQMRFEYQVGVPYQEALRNPPLKEKREEPQQSLAERISSEVAYIKKLSYIEGYYSDDENLTEFEYEITAISRALNKPEARKDQPTIEDIWLGTKLKF